MINWRTGKAGFVGASKRLVMGVINFTHTAVAALIQPGSVTCSLEIDNAIDDKIEFEFDSVSIPMGVPNLTSIRVEDICSPSTLKGILMKWTYDNDYDSFALEIGNYIVSRDIQLADITEVVFMVKLNATDEDVDAKATLTLLSGLTMVAGATEADALITANFDATDFGDGAMLVGVKYYIGLGIKTAPMPKYLEIKPVDDRLVLIEDFIHD